MIDGMLVVKRTDQFCMGCSRRELDARPDEPLFVRISIYKEPQFRPGITLCDQCLLQLALTVMGQLDIVERVRNGEPISGAESAAPDA